MSVASSGQARVVRQERVSVESSSIISRVTDYADMCRPRIAVMTMVATSAGFVLASPIVINWSGLIVALVGVLQLVAASSIFNQVLETESDSRMARTANRPLVSGRVWRTEAMAIAAVMTCSGTGVLWFFCNPATTVAGLLTLLVYVCVYTPLKTRSSLCTTIGAVPGAMPPVLGWLAAGGTMNSGAWALFALLFTWQFPHFLAIGWIYRDDYQRAGLRMLPAFTDGGRRAGFVATVYALAFVPVSLLPVYAGMTGQYYFATAALLSGLYLVATMRFAIDRTEERARGLLLVSVFILPILLAVMVGEFLHLTALG